MFKNIVTFLLLLITLSCTNTINRLKYLGKDIPVKNIEIPNTKADYQPIKLPRELRYECERGTANSLWKSSNRSFFRDHKARNVGDIIKIKVKVNDKAAFNNKTTKQRKSSENLAVPKLFGIQNKVFDSEEKSFSLLDLKGGNNNIGEGKIDRNENIDTEIAAMVAQIFPNGNMVVMGSQEIKVNSEVRQLSIKGIVRPEDVSIDNIVDSDKVAELRVIYGGQGAISDMQQPRLGTQIIDILSPF